MAENQPEDIAALEESSKGFDVSLLDKDPADLTPEQVTAIANNAKTQHGLANHWRGKAKDPESGKTFQELWQEKVKPAEDKPNEAPAQAAEGDVPDRLARIELGEEKRQFGHVNNLSPEETDEVFAYASGVGIKPKEALEKPFVKSAIDALRADKRTQGAIPGSSNRASVVDGKQFKDMNEEERRKNWGKVTGNQ